MASALISCKPSSLQFCHTKESCKLVHSCHRHIKAATSASNLNAKLRTRCSGNRSRHNMRQRTVLRFQHEDKGNYPSHQITLYTAVDPVFGGISPHSQSTLITLLEKRLNFNEVKIDLANRSPEFTELYHSVIPDISVRERVPVLVDGGVRLCESLVINEYLARRYPKCGTPLLPLDDPAAEALVKLFVTYFTDHVVPAYHRLVKVEDPIAIAEAKTELGAALDAVDAFLQLHSECALGEKWALGPHFSWSMHEELSEELRSAMEAAGSGEYFLGDKYSLAEVICTPYIERMLNVLPEWRGVDIMKMCEERRLLRLAAWMRAAVARPSARATCPRTNDIINGLVSSEWSHALM